MAFTLTSTAFAEGGDIPSEYTCDGANRPVPLAWTAAPDGTAEFALVMDDPDARGFVHWVVVAIPARATELAGGSLPDGAVEGQTGFGQAGYGGPCPPSGTHRYDFTLYALSSPLRLKGSPTADAVRTAAAERTLAVAKLSGRYARRR
jgi:Raf kinase inhibitor-like YbhB/YbcL family protein